MASLSTFRHVGCTARWTDAFVSLPRRSLVVCGWKQHKIFWSVICSIAVRGNSDFAITQSSSSRVFEVTSARLLIGSREEQYNTHWHTKQVWKGGAQCRYLAT